MDVARCHLPSLRDTNPPGVAPHPCPRTRAGAVIRSPRGRSVPDAGLAQVAASLRVASVGRKPPQPAGLALVPPKAATALRVHLGEVILRLRVLLLGRQLPKTHRLAVVARQPSLPRGVERAEVGLARGKALVGGLAVQAPPCADRVAAGLRPSRTLRRGCFGRARFPARRRDGRPQAIRSRPSATRRLVPGSPRATRPRIRQRRSRPAPSTSGDYGRRATSAAVAWVRPRAGAYTMVELCPESERGKVTRVWRPVYPTLGAYMP